MDSNQSHPYKAFSNNSRSQSSFQEALDPKMRYQIINRQQMQIQREKVHQKETVKKHREETAHRKHLIAEIAKKKKELEAIQKEQSESIFEESEAQRNAKLKAEKDRLLKMEKQLESQAAKQQAKYRQKDALKWLEKERLEINSKVIQANNLRSTHSLIQKKERKRADKFAQSVQQKVKNAEQRQKQATERSLDHYVKGLSTHGLHKKSLAISHSNPNIIISRQKEEEAQASKLAAIQQEKIKSAQERKAAQIDRNRQKATERGQQALQKMRKQREYQKYCQEAQNNQVKYNLKRIEAGQKNQYAGVKPMTLSQLEVNKKLRSEQQFQKLFFKGKKISSKTQVVSKYGIVENKMKQERQIVQKQLPKKKQPINYMEQESLIPGVSEGHYSFEEERKWTNTQQPPVENDANEIVNQQEVERQFEPKPIIRQSYFAETKGNAMKETRIPGMSGNRGELNYSQSEEDSNI